MRVGGWDESRRVKWDVGGLRVGGWDGVLGG